MDPLTAGLVTAGVAGVSGYGVVSDLASTPAGQKATAFVQDLQLQAKLNAANREVEELRKKVADGDANALTEKANAFKDEMKRYVSEAAPATAPAAQTGGRALLSPASPKQLAALNALVADMETRIDPASGDRYGLRPYADQIREVIDIIKGDLAAKNEETMKARYGDFMSYLDARKTGKGALADASYAKILKDRPTSTQGLSTPTQPTPAPAPAVTAVDPVVVPDAPPPTPPEVVPPPPAVIDTAPPPAPLAVVVPDAPPAATEPPSILDALASAVPSTAATPDEEINVLLGRVDSEVLDGLTPITVRAKKDALRLIERDFRKLQNIRLSRKSWPLLFASASQREDATGELERDIRGLVEGEAKLWTEGVSTTLATIAAADIEAFFDLRFDIRALSKDFADKTGTPEVLKTRTAALVGRLAALKDRIMPAAPAAVAAPPPADAGTGVTPAVPTPDASLPVAPPAVVTPGAELPVAPELGAGTGLTPAVTDTSAVPPVDTAVVPAVPADTPVVPPAEAPPSFVAPDRSSQLVTIHPQLLNTAATARTQVVAALGVAGELDASLSAVETRLLQGPPRAGACEFVETAIRPKRATLNEARIRLQAAQTGLSAASEEYAKETRGMTPITDDNFIVGRRQLAERRLKDNAAVSDSLTTRSPDAIERAKQARARDLVGSPLRKPVQKAGERIDLARLKAAIEDAAKKITRDTALLADQRTQLTAVLASADALSRQPPLTGTAAEDEEAKCRAYEAAIATIAPAPVPLPPPAMTAKQAKMKAAVDRVVKAKAVSDAARAAGASSQPVIPFPEATRRAAAEAGRAVAAAEIAKENKARNDRRFPPEILATATVTPPPPSGAGTGLVPVDDLATRVPGDDLTPSEIAAVQNEIRTLNNRRAMLPARPTRQNAVAAPAPSGAGTGLVPVDELALAQADLDATSAITRATRVPGDAITQATAATRNATRTLAASRARLTDATRQLAAVQNAVAARPPRAVVPEAVARLNSRATSPVPLTPDAQRSFRVSNPMRTIGTPLVGAQGRIAAGTPGLTAAATGQVSRMADSVQGTVRAPKKTGGRRTMRKKRLTSRRGKKTNGK